MENNIDNEKLLIEKRLEMVRFANENGIKKAAKIELARRNFFEFCHLLMPNFYKRDRKYLVDMCNELQSFVESDDKLLVINLPP